MMNPFKTIKGIVTTRLPLFSGVLAFSVPIVSIVINGRFGIFELYAMVIAATIIEISRWAVSQSK